MELFDEKHVVSKSLMKSMNYTVSVGLCVFSEWVAFVERRLYQTRAYRWKGVQSHRSGAR